VKKNPIDSTDTKNLVETQKDMTNPTIAGGKTEDSTGREKKKLKIRLMINRLIRTLKT
jgi:hypothetical protein